MNNTDRVAEQMYERAVAAVQAGATSVRDLQAACRLSHNGAVQFLDRMEQDGIVSPANEQGQRVLTATN